MRVGDRSDRVREVRELFTATQTLPVARTISEEEIAAEIEAYRAQTRDRDQTPPS